MFWQNPTTTRTSAIRPNSERSRKRAATEIWSIESSAPPARASELQATPLRASRPRSSGLIRGAALSGSRDPPLGAQLVADPAVGELEAALEARLRHPAQHLTQSRVVA